MYKFLFLLFLIFPTIFLEPASASTDEPDSALASTPEEYAITIQETTFLVADPATGETFTEIIPQGEKVRIVMKAESEVQIEWSEKIGSVSNDSIRQLTPWETYPHSVIFQTTADVPLYIKEGTAYIKKAGLLQNQLFEKQSEENGYLIIQYGQTKGYIKKEDTIPVPNGSLPIWTGSEKSYKKKSLTKATTRLMYKENGKFKTFARVVPNEVLSIQGIAGNFYIVEIGGRKAYVNKSDVSIHSGNYVNPHTTYTYEQVIADLNEMIKWYPDIASMEIIGKSVDGRNLYALKLGTGKEEVLINASHHAREHLTTNLVMEMIDQYAYAYENNQSINGYSVKKVLDRSSIWFVPMVNPDGVTLVQKGYKSAKNPSYVLRLNRNNKDFSAWKANIRGVDLNRQYPAGWSTICCDPGRPGPQNYKGVKALSEPEAKALYDFTLKHHFKTSASYHSSGQIIYWHFYQSGSRKSRDYALARKVSGKTGYGLVPVQTSYSGGGYNDWFIQNEKMPGFTIEISPYVGQRPVPIRYFNSIWKQNHSIGLLLANEVIK
ncbi:MAG TPA: M14 family metallocarboxypeptidase [Chondromyces sp.]|nr:M14 family metallocarboxypeptidase [Chondromyces sp.]